MRAVLFALLWVAAFVADAAAIQVEARVEARVEALAIPYASPWQRATPQQEAEDGALLLDAPEAGLHLAVPRPTRVLKADAATYYAKLTEKWQALYGSGAKISWLEFGGMKWLLCRRPASKRDVSVFHLSTVFEGRAYSVLLFAPAAAEALPKVALDLLAAVQFGVASPVASASADWVKTRTLYPRADAEVLEALVQDDIARLGGDGMVTGYGLDFSASGVVWFIEGYQWKSIDTRVTRLAWNQGGQLEVQLPAESAPSANWRLLFTLAKNEADVGAQLRVWDLCAPSRRVAEALDQLQRGAFAQIPRLALERATGCPEIEALAAPAALQGESGKAVQVETVVSLPPAPGAAQLAALRLAGLTRIALVEIALHPGPRRTGFGDRLIERARWYVVFEPGGAGDARLK